MRITPFRDQVLVRKVVCSQSDHYGETSLIHVPEDFRKVIKFCGQVLAVGRQVSEEIKVGDFILLDAYKEYAWETDAPEDGELALIPEGDVFAVCPERPSYLSIVPQEARRYDEVV